MAENDRPKAAKAPKSDKSKKPLGPLKMYVLYKGNIEHIDLKRNQRDVLQAFLKDRDLQVKEFTFERTAREATE